jgi:iron complex outermembrane recepter protein
MHKLVTSLKLNLVITSFLAVLLSGLHAQTNSTEKGTITGRVSNSVTSIYLEGAEVKLKNTNQATLTDNVGRFTFSNLDQGDYTLVITYLGLDTREDKVSLKAGEKVDREIALESEVYKLDTFTVVGEREGNAKAFTLQKNSENPRLIVDAEAFGTVADGNMGDFVKLLPGINAEGKNGETWAVRIRGMDPALNSVTLDGMRPADASVESNFDTGYGRQFDVGTVQMEGVSTIEFTKSATPSQPADSIGGGINIVSKSALDRAYRGPTAKLSGGAGFRSYRNDTVYSGAISASDQYSVFTDFRNIAVSFSASVSDNHIPINRVQQSWRNTPGDDVVTEIRVLDSQILRRRSGGNISIDYKYSENSSFRLRIAADNFNQKSYENYWRFNTENAALFEGQVWKYWKKRNSLNISLTGKQTIAGWKIDYGTQVGTSEGRNFDGDGTSKYLGGQVFYRAYNPTGTGPLVNTLRFNFRSPAETGREFYSVEQTGGRDVTNPDNWVSNNSGSGGGGRLRVRNIDTFKDTLGAVLNVQKTFEIFGVPVKFKNGLFFDETKTRRTQDEKLHAYFGPDRTANTADDIGLRQFVDTTFDSYPLFDGNFSLNGSPVTPQWIDVSKLHADLRNNPSSWRINNTLAGTFDPLPTYRTALNNNKTLLETIYAGYTEESFTLGGLNVLTGVRYEKTEIARRSHLNVGTVKAPPSGYQPFRTKQEGGYDYFFPSLHLRYALSSNLLARASASKSIGRPNLSALLEDSGVDYTNDRVLSANPELRPQRSVNLDYSLEYYFEPVGQLTAGFFSKNIKDFNQTIDSPYNPFEDELELLGDEDLLNPDGSVRQWQVRRRTNIGSAQVRGVELGYSQQFTFLPGPLKGLGYSANYTIIYTESSKRGRPAEEGNLTNYVPKIFNSGLTWRYRSIDLRIRYNWTDTYLRVDSNNVYLREFVASSGKWDLNASYKINDKINIYLNGFNIFAAPEEFYLGYGELGPRRLRRNEDNGARFAAGVNISL